jgi:hypothetical protein
MKKKMLFFVALALFALWGPLFGAEITVPRLEVVSRGSMDGGKPVISTMAEADIALEGGYKYGITLGLGFEAQNLEKAITYGQMKLPLFDIPTPITEVELNPLIDRYNNQAVLSVRFLEATVRELFGKPLELSFFAGHYNALGSGDEFIPRFGTFPVGTDYRDFFYFPEGLNGNPSMRYNGAIHSILGTGFALSYAGEKVVPTFYAYQDLSYYDASGATTFFSGNYSGDFRLLVNSPNVKFEFFAGGSYLGAAAPVFRGGLAAYFTNGEGVGFFLQAGIPHWDYGDIISIDDCYFLIEPRLHFGKAGLNVTFFYHPSFYLNQPTKDEGMADVNLKFFIGDISTSALEWGFESTVSLKINNGEDLSLWVSPFLSAVTNGLRWDFKVRVNPLYFNGMGDLAELYVGIRTAY